MGEHLIPLTAAEGGPNMLIIVALILALGVAAQVLADRFSVPSVLFLILAGVIVGPKGLSIVTTDVFGSALPTIVGVNVSIIVFEGAFHLKLEKLREAPSAALRVNYPTLLRSPTRGSLVEGGALMWTPGDQLSAVGR